MIGKMRFEIYSIDNMSVNGRRNTIDLFYFSIVSLSPRLRSYRKKKEKFSRTVGCVALLYAALRYLVPHSVPLLSIRLSSLAFKKRKEKKRKKRKKEKEKWFNSRQSSLLYYCGPRSLDPASRTSFLTLPRVSKEPSPSNARNKRTSRPRSAPLSPLLPRAATLQVFYVTFKYRTRYFLLAQSNRRIHIFHSRLFFFFSFAQTPFFVTANEEKEVGVYSRCVDIPRKKASLVKLARKANIISNDTVSRVLRNRLGNRD